MRTSYEGPAQADKNHRSGNRNRNGNRGRGRNGDRRKAEPKADCRVQTAECRRVGLTILLGSEESIS
jgi:hypothetical protein